MTDAMIESKWSNMLAMWEGQGIAAPYDRLRQLSGLQILALVRAHLYPLKDAVRERRADVLAAALAIPEAQQIHEALTTADPSVQDRMWRYLDLYLALVE